MRPHHYGSNFSFRSLLSFFIHEHPSNSNPFLKTSFWRCLWVFSPCMAGWQVPSTMIQPTILKLCPVVLPDQTTYIPLKYLGTAYHIHPVSFVPTLEPRHSPTTCVDGHVAPIQEPHVHMPAFLVMQRPHVTPFPWTRAWSKREEHGRECSVPQTQLCSPSLIHIWSIQEKPAKSKHCAQLNLAYLVAQLPRHTTCQMALAAQEGHFCHTKCCSPSLQSGVQEQK